MTAHKLRPHLTLNPKPLPRTSPLAMRPGLGIISKMPKKHSSCERQTYWISILTGSLQALLRFFDWASHATTTTTPAAATTTTTSTSTSTSTTTTTATTTTATSTRRCSTDITLILAVVTLPLLPLQSATDLEAPLGAILPRQPWQNESAELRLTQQN